MARRSSNTPAFTARRGVLSVVGAGAGALVAAAALATGSAAPAQADFEDLLEPIVQPVLSSLTDSIAIFDPAAALDFTNWADTLLDSLGSFDLATTSVAEPAAALAAASDPVTGTHSIPLEVLEGTEPAVNASIEGGGSVPLLVDTGSAGLVVPYQVLDPSNSFNALSDLFKLGLPTSFGVSGYSGGVEYLYLTYNNVSIDYLGGDGLQTDGPVNFEVYSFAPGNIGSLFTNDAFQNFLDANQVDGILGVGFNANGPEVSPFINYGGVMVDIPNDRLVVGDYTPPDTWNSTLGAPISTVYESINGGTFEEATKVSNNIDSGGVFGTIPSSLASSGTVPPGTEITVYNSHGDELYSYFTQSDFPIGGGHVTDSGPTVVSGNSIDSGVLPFLTHSVYLDYSGTSGTMYFSPATG